MRKPRHPTLSKVLAGTGVIAAALVSLFAIAAQAPAQRPGMQEARSPDLLPDTRQRALSQRARTVPVAPGTSAAKALSVEDVGDVDSFGREVRWLGVTQMNIELADTCPPPGTDPSGACAVLGPPGTLTSFAFDDVARITLPGKSAESLLCHWLSPFLTTGYANPTAAPVIAMLTYSPTLTIENPVLDDPALIDPMTGLPFNGRLQTSMSASERFELPLPAGVEINERTRDSAVCIAGFLTRRSLVENYGLTEAQAKAFFKKETTVRMNISGSARYVQYASMIFGLRIVGD
jgi:hypothetical protein